MGEVSFCVRTLPRHYSPKSVKGLQVHACIFACALKHSNSTVGKQGKYYSGDQTNANRVE